MQTQVKLPNAPSGTEPRSLAPMPQVAPGFGPLRRMLRQRWFVALRAFALFTLLWWAFFVWNGNPLQLPRLCAWLPRWGRWWPAARSSSMP